jgi:hypothetical protein
VQRYTHVHGFVKQSNGYIKIYFEPERGRSVTLLFPRLIGASTTEPSSQGAPLPVGPPEEVLLVVVVVDPVARTLTALAARKLGYKGVGSGGR